MTVNLSAIPNAFQLPRPSWDVIKRWVDEHIEKPNRPHAWLDIADQWLTSLNAALGDAYQTVKGNRLWLFAPRNYEDTETLFRSAEYGLAAITDSLGDIAGERWLGPLVILLFVDGETYGRYTSPFDPDGEYLRSGGMCLRDGYVHLALRPYHLQAMQRILLHEMTHACLSHLSLPAWLEEGVSQLAEEAANLHGERFILDPESARELRQFWQGHGLSEFWWGKGFYSLDEVQGSCYSLADILFRIIVADHRRRLPDFVRHAHTDDAGDSAAHQFLGKGLAELAAQFLGAGTWEPVPPDGPAYCRRGVLYLSRKQQDKAIADFTEALRLDPRLSAALANRGLVHSELKQYTAAIADYQQALQLNPYDAYTHNNLAWDLATCPEDGIRNGEKALEHAAKVLELFGGDPPWYCLGTLAAAHAEVGDFAEARRREKESHRLAPEAERPGCKERLKLYTEGKPCREAAKHRIINPEGSRQGMSGPVAQCFENRPMTTTNDKKSQRPCPQ